MAASVSEDDLRTAPAFRAGDVILSCKPWVWSFQYKYHKLLCAHCFIRSDNLRACSSCNLYRYCGTQCQTADWKKEHKHECEMLKRIQTNIVSESWNFDHDCLPMKCGRFGCCTLEILMAKVINKIKGGHKDKLAGYGREMGVKEILDLLPYDAAYEEVFGADLRSTKLPDLGGLLAFWTRAEINSIPEFRVLARTVYYNVFPINEQNRKLITNAAGIFPQALHRNMTAVCWDINVTMDFRGRTLLVHAMEDIPSYTGLKDLRQNELVVLPFALSVEHRRKEFQRRYLHPCECRKCTDTYEAEINPLKCVTSGCMERIPSDDRALEPCPQCGALNSHRLRKLKQFRKEYDKSENDARTDIKKGAARLGQMFRELENTNLLHKDAHLRFACGYHIAVSCMDRGRYAEAWNGYCGTVACVRNIYPKYHLGRAHWLMNGAAEIPMAWFPHIRSEERKEYFDRVLPAAREFLLEAQAIYRTISGDSCQWVQYIEELLQKVL